MNWEVNLQPVCWSVAVLGCCVADVVLGPCSGSQMIRSDVLLVAGYWRLGAWVVSWRRCADWSSEAAGEWVCPGQLVVQSCAEVRRGCRQVSPSWAAYCPGRRGDPVRLQASESTRAAYCLERHGDVRCGCRRVSPSCAAYCLEKRHGLLLLLLVMGRWSVMCRILQRIPLLCYAEYCLVSRVLRWGSPII